MFGTPLCSGHLPLCLFVWDTSLFRTPLHLCSGHRHLCSGHLLFLNFAKVYSLIGNAMGPCCRVRH
jgi:hypothetical protein